MDALKQALAQIDPESELRFFQQADSQSCKAYLTITNVSQGNVAYKVKTTSPRFYVVKPNQGIIEKGQKITIDITMIQSPENKIEENKFLVQVAGCDLQSSETYQLQSYWEKLPKNLSLSYKLKVSLAQGTTTPTLGGAGGATSPSFQEGKTARDAQMDTAASFRESQVQKQQQSSTTGAGDRRESQVESTNQAPQDLKSSMLSQGRATHQKHEYEKAPDDEINQSMSQQSLSQSQVVNQDQIKRKTEEVKQQLDQVLAQKQKIQQELTELKNKHVEQAGEKEGYDWQQPDSKDGFKFQLIHLLITAIICLFIGGYLGSRDTTASATIGGTPGDLNNPTVL